MNTNCYPHFLNLKPQEPVTLGSYFPELPKEFQQYYLCQFSKQNTTNNGIDNRKEAFVRGQQQVTRGENLGYEISPSATWRYKQGAPETYQEFTKEEVTTPDLVNLDGRGDVFYGYARNIDVESELKRINFRDDKCFDNNYKIDPNSPTTALYRHKDMIVKDYMTVQDGTYRGYNTRPLECLKEPAPATNVMPFPEYKDSFFEVGKGFDNRPNECYPAEQFFNNSTKRRIIYTRNKFEKNPEKYM